VNARRGPVLAENLEADLGLPAQGGRAVDGRWRTVFTRLDRPCGYARLADRNADLEDHEIDPGDCVFLPRALGQEDCGGGGGQSSKRAARDADKEVDADWRLRSQPKKIAANDRRNRRAAAVLSSANDLIDIQLS